MSGSLANARSRSVDDDLKTYMRMAFLCPSSSRCDHCRIGSPRAWGRGKDGTTRQERLNGTLLL
jgi:hypothetical protein